MNIKKVVLPAAGLGTRLLPITKETPKEMLPIYIRGENGNRYLKPVLQVIFEQLYKNNFREFIFIVGRSKRAIEDHFTIDNDFIKTLYEKNKQDLDKEMEKFVDDVIRIPEIEDEDLSTLYNIVALQLFSYYIADYLKRDIDKPRNLAKSVTVE